MITHQHSSALHKNLNISEMQLSHAIVYFQSSSTELIRQVICLFPAFLALDDIECHIRVIHVHSVKMSKYDLFCFHHFQN